MNTIRFFSLLFVISFAGCVHHNDNAVIINSMPIDSIFTEINIPAAFVGQTDFTFEGGKIFRFEIDTVEVRHFYSNCPNGNYFSTQIFITPGDSVSFKTVFKEISDNWDRKNYYDVIFEGKNAAHYNYASKKRKAIPQEEEPDYFSNPNIDLLVYKQQLQTYRDRENEFLRNYKKEYVVSNDFINYASAEINNLYAFKLYQAVYFNKCRIPAGYLDDAVIAQNPLSSYAFDALEFKYISCSPDVNIERIYNTILDEVHSKFHSSLLPTLITYFAQKGDRAYKESLLQVMNQIEKNSMDSTLLAVVKEQKPHYLLSGTMLPDSILDKTYLRSFKSNQKITLRQFFDNYKNTAIYLDFWASWCVPCRQTDRESAGNKPYFAEKQIAIVYISIDEDENAWLQAAKEDSITENQYLLLEAHGSFIDNFLKIGKGGIPRFVLFNKNHEIEILKAPRPVNCMFEELKKIIEHYPEKF